MAWTAHTINTAQLENCLAILSTDSENYAAIGRGVGLPTPFIRPAAIAADNSSSLAVVEQALQWFEQTYAYLPEQVMLLQPTSPFRPTVALKQALDLLQAREADSVIGCKAIERDLTSLYNLDQGFLRPLGTGQAAVRRQDMASLLTPNGALYLCKTDVILQKKSFYGERALPLEMDAIASLDIDTLIDWAIAEAYVQANLVS